MSDTRQLHMMRYHDFSILRTAAALVVVALLGAGCGVQAPEVTLESVRLSGLGLSGGTLTADLQVENPNRFSITAQRLRYQVAIAEGGDDGEARWIDLTSGVHEEELTVPPRDSARVRIPVEFTYRALGDAGARMVRQGSFDYRATGEVDVSTPLGTRTVPFRRHGTVALFGERSSGRLR